MSSNSSSTNSSCSDSESSNNETYTVKDVFDHLIQELSGISKGVFICTGEIDETLINLNITNITNTININNTDINNTNSINNSDINNNINNRENTENLEEVLKIYKQFIPNNTNNNTNLNTNISNIIVNSVVLDNNKYILTNQITIGEKLPFYHFVLKQNKTSTNINTNEQNTNTNDNINNNTEDNNNNNSGSSNSDNIVLGITILSNDSLVGVISYKGEKMAKVTNVLKELE